VIYTVSIILNNYWTPYNRQYWSVQLVWPFWVLELPKTLFTTYAFLQIALRVVVVQLALSRLYGLVEIFVQPIHEDRAGGLASIGEFVRKYVYWLLPVMAFLTGAALTDYSKTGVIAIHYILQLALFPFITLLFFVQPLRSTHWAMLEARSRDIRLSYPRYRQLLARRRKAPSTHSDKEARDLKELLETAALLYDTYPTWPFNSPTLRKYTLGLVASAIPLLAAIVRNNDMMERLLSFLGP